MSAPLWLTSVRQRLPGRRVRGRGAWASLLRLVDREALHLDLQREAHVLRRHDAYGGRGPVVGSDEVEPHGLDAVDVTPPLVFGQLVAEARQDVGEIRFGSDESTSSVEHRLARHRHDS